MNQIKQEKAYKNRSTFTSSSLKSISFCSNHKINKKCSIKVLD